MLIQRLLGLVVVLAGSLLISQPPGVRAQETERSQGDPCKLYSLPERLQPQWTISADWISPRVLGVVDSVGGEILRYTVEGKALPRNSGLLAKAVQGPSQGDFSPTSLRSKIDGTSWVQLMGGRFASVTEGGNVKAEIKLLGLALAEDRTIEGVYSWTAVGNELLAFGNLKDTAGTWTTGFYTVNPGKKSGTVVEELPRYSPERVWYRLGFSYLASVGDTVFALRVAQDNERLWIMAIPPSGESYELQVDLPFLNDPPALHDYESPIQFVQLMSDVEESTLPTGLFGWRGGLYIAWRKESLVGNQAWHLTKVELERPDQEGQYRAGDAQTVTLPTSANHLMVVPGPTHWALLAKGEVTGFGNQAEKSVRFIPASRIQNLRPNTTLCK